jgi:hypothetical protein
MVNDIKSFIIKSKEIHGNSFDYSLFEYSGSRKKSTLICKKCRTQFLTTPSNNLLGKGCKNCFEIKRVKDSNILDKVKEKHPNFKFDFTGYKNVDTNIKFECNLGHKSDGCVRNIIRTKNICIKCIPEISEKNLSKIERNNLSIVSINGKSINVECKKCNYTITDNIRNLTYEKFQCKYCILLDKSEVLKYGKSKLVKINGGIIDLICCNGHEYKQNRINLIQNKCCKKCYDIEKHKSSDEILEMFLEKHGDSFKYDMQNYKNQQSKIEITCKSGHKFHQKVSNHLQGKGCLTCNESSGEREIKVILDSLNINYTTQKKFDDCKYQEKLPFDFYLDEFNILIEYDGIQHFKPIEYFGGINGFEKTKIRDKIKNEYCKKNNIHLIRVSYLDDIQEKLEFLNRV